MRIIADIVVAVSKLVYTVNSFQFFQPDTLFAMV